LLLSFRAARGNVCASATNGRHDAQFLGDFLERGILRKPLESVYHCLLVRHGLNITASVGPVQAGGTDFRTPESLRPYPKDEPQSFIRRNSSLHARDSALVSAASPLHSCQLHLATRRAMGPPAEPATARFQPLTRTANWPGKCFKASGKYFRQYEEMLCRSQKTSSFTQG
jgi:hypothetical protein